MKILHVISWIIEKTFIYIYIIYPNNYSHFNSIHVYPLYIVIVLHVLFPNRLSGAPPPGKPSRWRPCDARVPGDTERKTGENLWKCMEHKEKTMGT